MTFYYFTTIFILLAFVKFHSFIIIIISRKLIFSLHLKHACCQFLNFLLATYVIMSLSLLSFFVGYRCFLESLSLSLSLSLFLCQLKLVYIYPNIRIFIHIHVIYYVSLKISMNKRSSTIITIVMLLCIFALIHHQLSVNCISSYLLKSLSILKDELISLELIYLLISIDSYV